MHSHSHELTLGLSFVLGAIHALEPGHGKTAMFVYLLGGRRSIWHPVVMGLTTAISHSVSLFAIAFAVHLTHHFVTGDHHHEEQVSIILQWASTLLLVAVGIFLLVQALRGKKEMCCHHHHHGEERQSCSEGETLIQLGGCELPANHHCFEHQPVHKSNGGYRMTALIGLAVGLLPCPSALAAYFTGLSAGSPTTAYLIIALFAAGIACSLSVVGILLQHFGDRFGRSVKRASNVPWMYVRAGLILAIGLFYVVRLVIEQGA
jgi:nickel/cobalt transporter (NicO) family protein